MDHISSTRVCQEQITVLSLRKTLILADGNALNRLRERKDLRALFRWGFGGCPRQTIGCALACPFSLRFSNPCCLQAEI